MSGRNARRGKGHLFVYFDGSKWAVSAANMPMAFTRHRTKRQALTACRRYRHWPFCQIQFNSQP
jgi:hypothetical protein